MLPAPKLPSLRNAVHRIVLYHQAAAVLRVSKDRLNEHGSYRQPGDEVSGNACVRWLPFHRSIHRFYRREAVLFRHVKSEHPSKVHDVHDSLKGNPLLPEVKYLCTSRRRFRLYLPTQDSLLLLCQMEDLHNHLQVQAYPECQFPLHRQIQVFRY